MLTLLLTTLAFAEDDASEPTESAAPECVDDCGGHHRERKPMRHDLTGEVYVQGIADHGTALGGGAELVQGWGFLKVDARGESYQHWIGRATIGVDLFPRSRFDFTLGAFAGTVGHAFAIDDAGLETSQWQFDPTVGVEVGLGTGLGPVSVHWEHANGNGDQRFSEDTVRLGFDIVPRRLTAFGQVVHFEPGDDDPDASGFGVGAALRI